MLFLPERNERRFEPMPQRAQSVDAGMAGGAHGDQPAAVMDSGMTVVHREFTGRPTAAATAMITIQDFLAVAGEAAARVGLPPIARTTQPGTKEPEAPAGAEKPGLPTAQ